MKHKTIFELPPPRIMMNPMNDGYFGKTLLLNLPFWGMDSPDKFPLDMQLSPGASCNPTGQTCGLFLGGEPH